MKPQISAAIFASNVDSSKRLLPTLKGFEFDVRLMAAASDLQEAIKLIQSSPPDIVILEVNDLECGVRNIELLNANSPLSAVFVINAGNSTEWILRLIRAGASGYLTHPVSVTELQDAVRKVTRARALQRIPSSKRGEVFSVYNPSGGMGTTTIAVNLAATLAAKGHHTALVDLNFLSSDASAFLDLTPRYTLESVVPKIGLVDANFLKSIIVPHASGVHFLDGPGNVVEASRISTDLIQEVIALLRTIFDYTVIDTGGGLYSRNLATFGHSDQILFTTVLNLPSLRNAKRYLEAMHIEGFGAKVKLVLNRHLPKDEIKVSDAEKVLNTKAYQTFPNCYTEVRNSITKGIPLVQCIPHSAFAKTMDHLTRQLCQGSNGSGRAAY